MENATKALYIAGMLLIALLVVALVAHTFNDVGIVQDEKDKKEYEESIYKFNREYEVFNKKVMYGTDVISCINKAESNNQKYEKSGKYSTTGASGQEVLINVKVHLNNNLEESLEINYIPKNSSKERTYASSELSAFLARNSAQLANPLDNSSKTTIADFLNLKDSEIDSDIKKLTFSACIGKGNKCEKDLGSKDLSLLEEVGSKRKFKNSNLYYLHKNSNDLEYVVYNSNKSNKPKKGMYELGSDEWSSIVLKTYLADFKSRKFKCSEIKYDNSSGLVNEVDFIEI